MTYTSKALLLNLAAFPKKSRQDEWSVRQEGQVQVFHREHRNGSSEILNAQLRLVVGFLGEQVQQLKRAKADYEELLQITRSLEEQVQEAIT